MSHETSLIATLALSLIGTLIGALAATRLRLPLFEQRTHVPAAEGGAANAQT